MQCREKSQQKLANISLENVAKFKYLGTTVTSEILATI
jgi:hypothetical protein